jgi:hypothetical protein
MTKLYSERTAIAYGELYHACYLDLCSIDDTVYPFGWVPTSDTPNPYRGIRAMLTAAKKGPFEVSNLEHNGAFLGDDLRNLTFRAHHDAMHLQCKLGFELEDEINVCKHTMDRLIGGWTLSRDAQAVLTAELIGQAAYYGWYGAFPLTEEGLQPIFHVTDARVRTVDRDAYLGRCWGEYEPLPSYDKIARLCDHGGA